jgi:hypothetical protein
MNMDFNDYKICYEEDEELIKKHNIKVLFVGFHERYGSFGRRTSVIYWLPAYKVYRLFTKVL